MTVNNDPFVTLENALNEVFHSLNYKSCLLTICMNTVAIMMPFPDVFKVFDSHTRDLYGVSSMSGYCVLISVEGIQNLVQYFHLTSQCSASNGHIPFELKGVTCVRVMDVCSVIGQSVLSDNTEMVGSLEPENRGLRYAKSKENNNVRKIQRQNESLKEKQARLEKERLQKKDKKENESLERREQRLAKVREYNNRRDNKQQNESPQEKKARLEKQNLQKKMSRKNESLEQREQRLAKVREYNRKGNKEQGESPQEKKARLEKQQLRKKKSRKNESLEQREQRLAKMREYVSNKRKIESQKASPASRGQKSSKQKRNIGNHEPTDKQTLTENVIRNFHESVSTGPLYICTCCDQLWYRHSVFPPNQLTLKNPDMVKYLQDIVSVDNIKWVCQTCSKHLKKVKFLLVQLLMQCNFPQNLTFLI